MRRILTFIALTLAGCMGFAPAPEETLSWGTTNSGILYRGVELPDRGPGWVRARPGESTRYGTPRLLDAIQRAIVSVDRQFPGTAPMRIGDVGAPGGGRHPRHNSHRSGRDVDVIFYMTDPSGRSIEGRGWLAYNRFGFAVEREEAAPTGDLYFFDDARNWHFVRTLLLDDAAAVQWIFCSRGTKARLLRYAIDHERDPNAILRASYALAEPTGASPHDDHFHVRVMCTTRELGAGCWDRGLMWPWLRAENEKPDIPAGEPLDDARILRELFAEPSP